MLLMLFISTYKEVIIMIENIMIIEFLKYKIPL